MQWCSIVGVYSVTEHETQIRTLYDYKCTRINNTLTGRPAEMRRGQKQEEKEAATVTTSPIKWKEINLSASQIGEP